MKNKKGFTLVELLAVIVVLAVILVIAGTNVSKSIEDTRNKAKFMAAKEIVEIASAFMYENSLDEVSVTTLIGAGYLESDVTNPKTGENGGTFDTQKVYKSTTTEQSNYEVQSGNRYNFNGYYYQL